MTDLIKRYVLKRMMERLESLPDFASLVRVDLVLFDVLDNGERTREQIIEYFRQMVYTLGNPRQFEMSVNDAKTMITEAYQET